MCCPPTPTTVFHGSPSFPLLLGNSFNNKCRKSMSLIIANMFALYTLPRGYYELKWKAIDYKFQRERERHMTYYFPIMPVVLCIETICSIFMLLEIGLAGTEGSFKNSLITYIDVLKQPSRRIINFLKC